MGTMNNYDPEEESQVRPELTREEEDVLNRLRETLGQTTSGLVDQPRHLRDAVLFDLALEALPQEDQLAAQAHLAICEECVRRLVTLQEAIQTDRTVSAVWDPEILHAAGESRFVPILRCPTEDGKYVITLQPTRNGQKDLLTLEVTPLLQERFEGLTVVLVSSRGKVILRGTISEGNITRLIDRQLREEWPFRIQAG